MQWRAALSSSSSGCVTLLLSAAASPSRLTPNPTQPTLNAADLTRLASAIQSDLRPGSPHEVRAKALAALALLPGHRLEALLLLEPTPTMPGQGAPGSGGGVGGNVLERVVSAAAGQGAGAVMLWACAWQRAALEQHNNCQ